jgi:cytochrome c553
MSKWREWSLAAAVLPLVSGQPAFGADRELGQHLSSECVTCHRPSGPSAGGVPGIFGWPEDQFVAVMLAYRRAERDNPVMRTIAGRLNEAEIAALAAYFGGLPESSRTKK